MKKLMIAFIVALLFAGTASADLVCVKKKVRVVNGKVNLGASVTKVSGSTCPASSKLIANLSALPNESGATPATVAGKLLTGSFSTGGTAASAGDYSAGIITFPFPLSGTKNAQVVESGGSPTAQCPGTYAAPDAVAGYLCIYVSFQDNVTNHTPYGTIDSFSAEASRLGAAVYSYATSSGRFYSWGTWAVRE
jgi:hypothetical protein